MRHVVTLDRVRKSFGRQVVLEDATLAIERGTTSAIVGPNGSGKSVLLKLLCGFLPPDDGTVQIDPALLSRGRTFPDRYGVCINGPAYLPGLSAERNLMTLVRIRDRVGVREVRAALERVGLDAGGLRARHFSLGMKQKLSLAQALVEDPEVLVLDEPFDALDAASVIRVKGIFEEERAKGTTIVFTSHRASDVAELAQVVYRIEDRRVLLS